ncbi:DUF1674-domain-containing protein [Durotheca rogersii]|uniref:DUF1674-domain-containing protein n=1 Tax=Durotheca rogersii TaxID=419775 RepID=UPI00221FDEB4|nr:DUF1674-domain-containing protein [Durotheca rogersii]KAI5856666.1 DUF1674-domain-containing protein [Durotheca rogersii]
MASRALRLARPSLAALRALPFLPASAPVPRHPIQRRPLHHSSSSSSSSSSSPPHDNSNTSTSNNLFRSAPAPPRLPPEQQAEFERLQHAAGTEDGFVPTSTPGSGAPSPSSALPLPLRQGAPPEFDGDVNPRTGEVGGPKNEPLRWGPGGDYSFNGRVTDF